MIIDVTGIELTPGNRGKNCLGNGKHKRQGGTTIECCCDECAYYLCCFQELSETECKSCNCKECYRSGKRGIFHILIDKILRRFYKF